MSSEQYMYTTQDLERHLQQQQIQQDQENFLQQQKAAAVNANILKEPKTSISHPINISWIIPPDVLGCLAVTDFPNDFDLYDVLNPYSKEKLVASLSASISTALEQQQQQQENGAVNTTTKNRIRGNLCLSSCPGKKVRLSGPVRGRAAINRDLDLDFARMKSFGITMLVCCLDDTELDFLGASWPKYEAAAKAQEMQIIRLPMVEGGCPQTLNEVKEAVDRVNQVMYKGGNVLVHCRGGVGRAGLFAGCWLLENLLCKSVERAVYILREQRSPKAIETLAQVEYLIKYAMSVNKRLGLQFKMTETDTSGDIIQRTPNGAPSIPLIAKLENQVFIDSDIILKDDITSNAAIASATTAAATATNLPSNHLQQAQQQQQQNQHPWWWST